MAKRVFFSFHYDDVKTFRANVVRNHSLLKESGTAGFFDASIWEDAELHGSDAVKRLINTSLINTSVTCVLIGSQTWSRRWVRYEILKSYERGNKIFGIHINSIKDKNNQTFLKGPNPFDYLGFYIDSQGKVNNYQDRNGPDWKIYNDLTPTIGNFDKKFWDKGFRLSDWIPVYDWVADNGYNNFAKWVENAV
jgi:hypothetical protein